MYYVYYIQGKKIGCTKNLYKRVILEQGYSKNQFKILYSTKCIKEASNKEIYYQKKLGYKLDNKSYIELIKTKEKMIHITNQTTTFKVKNKREVTKDYLINKVICLEIEGKLIQLNDKNSEWILRHLKTSQYGEKYGFFIYNQAFVKANEDIDRDKNIFNNIRDWAKERGIFDKGDSKTQYIKLQEEAGELAKALLKNDKPEIIDAIGDIAVVLTNLAHLENLRIEDCINSAYNVISKRKGKMINGTFVKNR